MIDEIQEAWRRAKPSLHCCKTQLGVDGKRLWRGCDKQADCTRLEFRGSTEHSALKWSQLISRKRLPSAAGEVVLASILVRYDRKSWR